MFLRSLVVLCAIAALTACDRATTPLALPTGFYPSALAVDPVRQRYLVGSLDDGEVAVLDRRGRRLGAMRASTPGEGVLRMAVRGRTLWIALPRTIEAIDLDRPQQPRRAYRLDVPVRFADMALGDDGRVYLLDAERGEIYALDPARATSQRLAVLPRDAATTPPALCPLTDQRAPVTGALLVMPGDEVLLVAINASLYRVQLSTRRLDRVALREPLSHVTQLLQRVTPDGRHEVLAVRGAASRITHLRLDDDFRRVRSQASYRVASTAPVAAALEDGALRMVHGSLRHHPYYCGDGRPSAAIRLVTYRPKEAGPQLRVAAETGDH